jgi:hypothetical protein
MSNVRIYHNKLSQVIILYHSLQKIYYSSVANTWISSVGAIHITKSKVAQIISRSNINIFHHGLSQVLFWKHIPNW